MLTWIRLALALAQLLNRVLRRIEQRHWEASGFQKAMADELAAINASVGVAKESFEEAAKATPEQRRRSLREPI